MPHFLDGFISWYALLGILGLSVNLIWQDLRIKRLEKIVRQFADHLDVDVN